MYLCGSGVSALAAIFFASGYVFPLSETILALSFIQLSQFGVTIAKAGLDQAVFAKSGTTRRSLTGWITLTRWPVGPLAVLFVLLASAQIDLSLLMPLLIAVFVDSIAVIKLAELVGQQRYVAAGIATTLNFPVFVLVALVLKVTSVNVEMLFILAYCLSSVCRFLFCVAASPGTRTVDLGLFSPLLIIQQVLNLALFKSDQLFLSTAISSPQVSIVLDQSFVSAVFFLGRVSDFFTNAMLTAAAITFPNLYFYRPAPGAPWVLSRRISVSEQLAVLAFVIVVLLVFWLASSNFSGQIPFFLLLSTSLHVLLIFPANLATYSLMRADEIALLVVALTISVAVGLGSLIMANVARQPILFAFCVPAQLATFVFLCIALSRKGRKHETH